MNRSLNKIAVFWGGAIVESLSLLCQIDFIEAQQRGNRRYRGAAADRQQKMDLIEDDICIHTRAKIITIY